MVPTLKCTHSRKYLFTLFLAKRTLDFSIIYYWLLILHSFEISLTLSRTETHSQSSTRDHQKNEICTTIKHARALLSRLVSSRPVSFYNTQMMDDRTVLRLLHFCFMLFYVLFAGVRYTVAVFVCCCLLAHDTMKRETKKICSFFFCCIGRNSRL